MYINCEKKCLYKIRKAQKILKILKKRNFESFIVGGAVRDLCLGLEISEIDITTNALVTDIQKIFLCYPKGIKYGLLTIFFDGDYFDIASYRREGSYYDYRHPSTFFFISDIKEDLLRRDFTINSLLLDHKDLIIDYNNGYEDLIHKKIKTIGDSYQKLTEDVLRMMRIFYFQAKLNFDIEEKTQKILKSNIFLIQKIQPAKILEILKKIIKQKYFRKAFISFLDNNALSFLPGFQKSIMFILQNNILMINEETFFSLSFRLEPKLIDYYPFSKKEKVMFRKNIFFDD
ncbi:CCA tRNA nucleotidyltransferase [Candidatus Phytoplasma pini]|uniref:Poly(A)polymerase n=1 Tax=Candidatus Phytoplasma pini TaxID=267362 RepID=A0A559KJU8_9MOLU|nr:CCA tRNA nucleotidyltransferase [Candidatus Phytoplasma pini]TVY12389.1 poly(A)polymerase [Candidatus Phytoplasma pini]